VQVPGKNRPAPFPADACNVQFSDLCFKASRSFQPKFADFSRSRDRLDSFYYDILGQDPAYAELFAVFRLVLTLSHGNASVESGFSINEDMLVENLHEDSLVAQRTVYDSLQSAVCLTSVPIDNSMLSYVRGSHARYLLAMEEKRKTMSELEKQKASKKRAADAIKDLQAKKAKLVQDASVEAKKMDMEIAELKKLQM